MMNTVNCYIKDFKGSYYRINEKQELVIAKEKESASLFSVEEASNRIGKGKKSHFYIIENVENELTIYDESTPSVYGLGDNIEGLFSSFYRACNNIDLIREELQKEQSDVDQEISDIYHYIEFFDGDVEQLLEVTLLLQNKLRSRRDVKNRLAKIQVLKDTIFGKKCFTIFENANLRIEKMKFKKYRPRRLNSLFDEPVVPA